MIEQGLDQWDIANLLARIKRHEHEIESLSKAYENVWNERDALRQACEAVLLFYSGGHWDTQMKLRWDNLTHHADATTKGLCGVIRKALKAE